MLIKRDNQNLDPEEQLAGLCGSCKTLVTCERWEATRPPAERAVGKEPGVWNDLNYTGCPKCNARVYLMPRAAFVKCYPGHNLA